MRKLSKKKIGIIAIVLTVCIVIPLAFSFTSSAKMVDVYTMSSEEEHLTLEWKNIHDDGSNSPYAPSAGSQLVHQENGNYKMTTDSWAMWSKYDSVSYAYTKAPFNTGEGTVMTIKMTVNDWDGKEIGIMVRKSLSADSEALLGSFREKSGYLIYRNEKTSDCSYITKSAMTAFGSEDMHLKMTLDKTKGKVNVSYKKGGDINSEDGWISLADKTCKFLRDCKELYAGIGLSNNNEGVFSTALCSNFSINLQAPEGYVIEGDDGSGGNEGSEDKEPEVVLPEDLAAAGDTLLYETFTDGNMFPADEESITITNPIWTVRSGEPVIETNESATNRCIITSSVDEPLMITAGDMGWTDYSVQMDVVFPKDVVDTDTNEVSLLFRHRSAWIGGSAEYAVTLKNEVTLEGLQAQYISLNWRGAESTFLPGTQTLLGERIRLAEKNMVELGVTHTIKVDVIDNKIKVYFDDMSTPILTYEDTNTGGTRGTDPHLTGCIGIIAENATVKIDNILVRKLSDPLGGDYDNDIMGNYDEPIPDWIAENYGYGN